MKTILIGCLVLWAEAGRSQDLRAVRSLFLQAGNSEEACRDLLAKARSFNESNAVMMGYAGAAAMIMARHTINPFAKISWFREGRRSLDSAIGSDSWSAELHYLRYCIQRHCPGFLGYNGCIAADRAFLFEFLQADGDNELKKMIHEALSQDPAVQPSLTVIKKSD